MRPIVRRFARVAVIMMAGGLHVALTACGTSPSSSAVQGLAANGSGHNAAVIFGAPRGLAGVPTDVREFGNLLHNAQYDFRFQDVRSNGNANVREILELTGNTAKEAESMIWFFSGHGNRGIMLAKDQTFTFHQVADAIRQARQNVPLKRLIVFIDSCYSGSFVNGNAPIIEDTRIASSQDEGTRRTKCALPAEAAAALDAAAENDAEDFDFLDARDRGIFEQAFVLASSTKDESSIDLGSEQGGAFTWSMRQVVANFGSTDTNVSIKQFADATSDKTEDIGGHTPVYRAYPSTQILAEPFFKYAGP